MKNLVEMREMREKVAGLAPDIAAAVQQGASRASQVEKYKLTDYWVCAALYVMGMDIPHDNLRKNIVKSMAKYRRAQTAHKRYEANKASDKRLPLYMPPGTMREIPQAAARHLLQPRCDADEALKKELRQDTTLVYRQDQKIKKLEADIEQWMKEVERLTPFEKKYTELMAAYNEKIAAEVAAEETLAHR